MSNSEPRLILEIVYRQPKSDDRRNPGFVVGYVCTHPNPSPGSNNVYSLVHGPYATRQALRFQTPEDAEEIVPLLPEPPKDEHGSLMINHRAIPFDQISRAAAINAALGS